MHMCNIYEYIYKHTIETGFLLFIGFLLKFNNMCKDLA